MMMLLVVVVFLLLCPFHSISVANLKYFETLSHVTVTSSMKRSADGSRDLFKHVTFRAFDRKFKLTMKPGTRLMAPGFRARLIGADGSSSLFHLDHNQMFSGHLSDRPDVKVHAHTEDMLWSIQIFDHKDIYIVEPAWRLLKQAENPSNDTLIAYRASDLTSDSFNSSQFCDAKGYKEPEIAMQHISRRGFFRFNKKDVNSSSAYRKGKSTRDKRANLNIVCVLYLVGDYTFYKGKCNGNHFACAALMFASVNLVDNIYTTSDFEDPDYKKYMGVGVQIGEIAIYKTYTKEQTFFQQPHFNAKGTWTASKKLESFGYYISFLSFNKHFCAHNLFTDYPFPKRILGITWMRTLCYSYGASEWSKDAPGSVQLNSAVSSGTDIIAGALPTLQMNLVFAHASYLHFTSIDLRYQLDSSHLIFTTAYANSFMGRRHEIARQGHIFGSEHDPATTECSHTEQYGGNYIMWSKSITGKHPNNFKFSPCSLRHIGLQLQQSSCLVPRSTAAHFCGNGAIEDNEVCDAGSFGMIDADMCCNSTCRLRQNATCSDTNHPCCKDCKMAPANTPCLGGEPAECTMPSSCTGLDYVCPDPAKVADGTPCPGFGRCYSGKCLSFCSTLSRSRGLRLQGCLCRTNDNGAACKWCCFDVDETNGSDTCRVYSTAIVSDGMQCYMGFCKAGVCESYEVGTIQRIYRFLPNIKRSELLKFWIDHLVLCLIVISLILFLPPAIIIYRAADLHIESSELEHESQASSKLTDYAYVRALHRASASVITFVYSEASKISTVKTSGTVISDQVSQAQSDALDRKAHSDDADDRAHSDIVDAAHSDNVDGTADV